MTQADLLARITIDPHVCFGKPCMSMVLDPLAEGATQEEFLAQYPGVVRDDIRACLAYASEMTRERTIFPPHSAA